MTAMQNGRRLMITLDEELDEELVVPAGEEVDVDIQF